MNAARAAGRDAAAPGPPRRASSAIDFDVRAAAASAAAAAAAAAADFGTSPKSDLSVSSSTISAATATATAANGEAVETLYSHPAAKIISFTAGGRNSAFDAVGSAASSRGRSRRSLTQTTLEDDIEPGTLPSSSQFDRTIAVGALSIYRAPGSVAFLSCGTALQPILPKSQCWCIDEASSKFILQIRRPQYWRIEVPVGDDGENDERARRLREVLDHILQFEKTPCPFKRAFTVELPELPTPLKKKPWTPVKCPETDGAPAPTQAKLKTTQQGKQAQAARSPSPPSPEPPISPAQRRQTSPSTPAPPVKFTRREWLAMLESQKRGDGEEVDEYGRRVVPALVAEHEQRIMDLKASEIEVNKMGSPWRNTGSFSSPSGGSGSGMPRDRATSLASDNSAARSSAWPSLDRRWLEESDHSTTADSSSPFNSLRSWLSSGGKAAQASSPPSSTSGSVSSFPNSNGADASGIPPSLSSLYEDARRMFNGNGTLATAIEQQQLQPRIRHRATTSSISMSNHPALPAAVDIIAPSHLRNLHRSGRATTRLEAMRRIPGSIIYRVFEILLAPPSYLLTLMLRIAARILSGEWRGFAVGKNTDTGESIPVQWDYTDVDDPLGRSTELPPRQAGVDRLTVYTEADVEVYTDAEDDEDDEDADNTARCFPSAGSPKRSSSTASKARSDSDTLSDAGGDPIVWTRRWAVD